MYVWTPLLGNVWLLMITGRFFLPLLGLGLLAGGCGGGGAAPLGSGGPTIFSDNSDLQGATAKVEVDLVTGETVITPLGATSRAVFGSGAIGVSSAEVFRATGGSVSARTLRLTFRNNSQVDFGASGGLRFLIGAASPGLTASTEAGIGAGARTDGSVASAAVGSPSGVWEDSDGTLFISQGVDGAIRTVRNGSVSTLNTLYNSPRGITGNPNSDFIYFCETGSHRIIRLRKDGKQGNVVAGAASPGDAVGAGASARFNTPIGLTSDPNTGTLYVADYANGKIKAIANPDTSPTVSTLATGIPLCLGIGFGTIEGRSLLVATSSGSGQVFLIDPTTGTKSVIRTLAPSLTGATIRENRVLVASSTHQVTVLRTGSGASPFEASSWQVEGTLGSTAGFADGVNARFNAPQLMSSGTNNVYMCDSTNHRVRRLVLPNFLGGFSTQPAVFTNTQKFTPSNQGIYELGTLAKGATVTKDVAFTVQFGASMTFFVTVTGGTDGVVPLDGAKNASAKNVYLRLLAGSPTGETGQVDGVGGAARFSSQNSIATTSDDYVFVGSNQAVRIIAPDGTVRTIANKSQSTGTSVDGNGNSVVFAGSFIRGLYSNRAGTTLLVSTNSTIYRGTRSPFSDIMNPSSWTFQRIAGSTDGSTGDVEGDGDTARFSDVAGICMSEDETRIFATCFSQAEVELIENRDVLNAGPTSWQCSVYAGSGSSGFADGNGTLAQFSGSIQGLDVDRFGNVYVAEDGNARIRKIDLERNVTTVVGDGTYVNDDNNGTFAGARYLAVDDSDSIYFANGGTSLRVFRNGQLYTVAISGAYSGDGFVENFAFSPRHMAVNKATGRLFTGRNGQVFSLDPLVP